MNEEERFTFVDENNQEKEYIIITSFLSEVTNQKYIVGIEEQDQPTLEYELFPFVLNETTNKFIPVEKQIDLDEVQRVLDQMIKEVKENE